MADKDTAFPWPEESGEATPSGRLVDTDESVRSIAERGIEAILQYRFADIELLRDALRHPSAAKGDRDAAKRFQRMEFLGDRVLGLVIATQLYHRFPNEAEGQLSLRFTQLVRTETLVEVAVLIGLARALIRNGGDRDNRDSMLADSCEAMLGALYLDGGMDEAASFIRRQWHTPEYSSPPPGKDAKSELQEYAQGLGLALPSYVLVRQSGSAHAPCFRIRAELADQRSAEGEGRSKRSAETAAARNLLLQCRAATTELEP